MSKSFFSRFAAIAALMLVVGMVVVKCGQKFPPATTTEDDHQQEPRGSSPENRDYAGQLIKAGWQRGAANAVAELNAEWFDIMVAENRNGLQLQLKLLADLKDPVLQKFIEKHPETAGLLAGSNDPAQIVASLNAAGDDYRLAAGLYVRHPATDGTSDADAVAAALQRNHDLIAALLNRGLIGCEALFLFERQNAWADTYDSWLRETIEAKSEGSDVAFASFINLVMRHGPMIRRRLRDDPDFRRHFRDELWPRLTRAVGSADGMFELYLDDERVGTFSHSIMARNC